MHATHNATREREREMACFSVLDLILERLEVSRMRARPSMLARDPEPDFRVSPALLSDGSALGLERVAVHDRFELGNFPDAEQVFLALVPIAPAPQPAEPSFFLLGM